jgi:hypothetical protein
MIAPQSASYPEALAAELRKAFPSYSVVLQRDRGVPRFHLVARDGRNPWCLVSDDAREIWAELNGAG